MLKSLQNIGLSEKEAKVYLALLELGKATVQNIAQKASVNRATTYVQLETLKTRGLVSQVMEGRKTFFMAEAPDNVERMIEKQKVDVLYKEKEAKKILPDLAAVYDLTKKRPNVRFFEGIEAVKAHSEYLVKHPPKRFYSLLPILDVQLFNAQDEVQTEKDIMAKVHKIKDYRVIYVATEKLPLVNRLARQHANFKVRWIPSSKLDLKTELVVMDDEVWMLNFVGKPLGVSVQDKIITQSFESIFKLLWSIAK